MKLSLKTLIVPLSMGLTALCPTTASAQVNYDTAWTFVYDMGGIDNFYDVKSWTNGVCLCVGESVDTSTGRGRTILMKINASGHEVQRYFYTTNNPVSARYNNQYGRSLVIARNGDFIIGGARNSNPLVMRTDTAGNLKWSTWYYDSANNQSLLVGHGIVNCLRENRRGSIVCAVGDNYPDNNGQPYSNYAAYLEFDSTGHRVTVGQWNNSAGWNIGGFDIEEAQTGQYLLSGNQGVFYLDSTGAVQSYSSFSFYLTGVGTEVNQVNRAKVLRNGTPIVAGMAYEGNCWVNYGQLYYDAWWKPISGGWDTAGTQGANDVLYDFTQLINGNLVFVGKNGNTTVGGVWVFVTDSTGKSLLWQNQFLIPYRSADGRAPRPLSVCATPDSGFTVVGDYACVDSLGGVNAFAAHFVPRPPVILPGPVSLATPANAVTDQPVSLTFVWHTATNALTYHFQISTGTGGNPATGFSNVFAQDSTLTDTTFTVSGLSHNTTYYWHVRAKNADGVGTWAPYRQLTTIPIPPVTPNLVSPPNGATAQPVPLSLVWNKVSGAASYYVQVSTDPGFATFFLQDSSLTDSQRVVSGLGFTTTYYWRVRAKNTGGSSSWTSYWSFTTNVAPPAAPTLVSPANGATGQPISLSLVWNLTTNATTYHVQVATDAGFLNILTQDSTVTDTFKLISGLSNGATYYWRVRAKNSAGSPSLWASYRSFTTILALPGPIVTVSPADSAIIIMDSVRLKWNIGTPAVDQYLVEVAMDSAMTNFLGRDSSVTDTTILVSPLADHTTYYWRVKAHNAAGWGSYSAETWFVTSFTGVLFGRNGIRAFSLKYSSGVLRYTLPKQCMVSIKYYDIRGRMVGSYVGRSQGAGSYTLALPLSSWSTGTYVQVFEAGENIKKDRIMVVK